MCGIQVREESGILASVMQLLMEDGVESNTRHAAAVYLKNLCKDWLRDSNVRPTGMMLFESDKRIFLDNILPLVVKEESNPILRQYIDAIQAVVRVQLHSEYSTLFSHVPSFIVVFRSHPFARFSGFTH